MNVESILFWIRLIAQAIVDILSALPGARKASVGGPSGFKPERIQVWLGILARAALTAVDEVGSPPEPGAKNAAALGAGIGTSFKPERIQFWLQLIARFVLAVLSGVSEETGKSGARSGAPASEEVDDRW